MIVDELKRVDDFASTLYNQLMQLVSTNEAFYFSDQVLDNSIYRIFNYRLASYSDFLLPGALECRGVMFEIDDNGNHIRVVSLPMHKFFNLYENPTTMNVDLNDIKKVEVKSDGSLISTYIHYNRTEQELRLKSKGSISSDQALAAMRWLNNNKDVYEYLYNLTINNFTVNLEWVSPDHRIVLGYLVPRLIFLNARHTKTGEYLYPHADKLQQLNLLPDPIDLKGLSISEFINQVPDMTEDIEGFVCKTSTIWFKIKTKKYLALHHCKDSVNNPRRLFEVILNEGIDDVKSLFHEDELLMKQICEMEQKVDRLYNHMVNEVETFYAKNYYLDRKEYAIKAQQEVTKLYFGLVMNKYSKKPDKYKDFLISKWKELGFKDETVINE